MENSREIKRGDKVLFPTHEEGRVVEVIRKETYKDNLYRIQINKPGKTYFRGEIVRVTYDKFKIIQR